MLTIDNAVSEAFPGVKMGVLAMTNVNASAPLAPSVFTEAMNEIQRRYGQLDRAGLKGKHPIDEYVAYYKKFGYSYHVLAQLESVLQGKKQVRAASGLLQAMFLTELESMLLTAGHDLVKLQMPISLQVASGDETYQSISGRETTAVRGDLIVCDGGGVLSSIMRGPDFGSRITASTSGVLFTIYAPPGVHTAEIKTNLHKLEEMIRSFSRMAETDHLAVH